MNSINCGWGRHLLGGGGLFFSAGAGGSRDFLIRGLFRLSNLTVNEVAGSSRSRSRSSSWQVQGRRVTTRSGLEVLSSSSSKSRENEKSSIDGVGLKGKDLITFDNLTSNDILNILWLALDLKSQKSNAGICDDKRIFCIYEEPLTKLTVSSAAKRIGGISTCIREADINHKLNLEYFGKSISSAADIILIDSLKWSEKDLVNLALGSQVPVINLRSTLFAPALTLAECLTLQEHYSFLKRLTLAYIGPENNSLFNTYAVLLPKLGIHFRYVADGPMNEGVLEKALELAKQNHTELHHCDNMADAIFRANIVSTCFQNLAEIYLIMKDIKERNSDWILFHSDPYKSTTVEPAVINSSHSSVWDAIANLEWIIKAKIVATISDYKPTIPRPKFEAPTT